MTDDAPLTSTPPRARRRSSLLRTVLGVAIAAVLAAWLPFTVMYVTALERRTAAVAVTWKSGHAVLTTKTSGGQTIQTAAPASQPTQTPVSVTTRSS
ncbi:MAG TPA: hypothetical protein VMU39_10165 [Solirubrobacteraceae bacterium]|nr:hypothetical protein [Solirubrobacteraceae bacterium]